jgi:predicted P-loop ATPase
MSTARFAEGYVRKYGIAIVKIEPGSKGPRGMGWNAPGGYFTDSSEAAAFFSEHPSWNMGAVLGPSGLCSIDVDNVEYSSVVLSHFGIDVHELARIYPTIVGNPARFRVMFRVPEGASLDRKALTWPNLQDPDGSKHSDLIRRAVAAKKAGNAAESDKLRDEAKRFARITVMELRAGLVQDVLPPSIHPETHRPYEWRTRPSGGFIALDERLLALWLDWDGFKAKAEALCPWAPRAPRPAARGGAGHGGVGVIEAFNRAHRIEAALEHYGYEPRAGRWLSPHSSTGMPGVWVQEGHNRAWNEHASDPLCSSTSKHPVGPFDLFCYYDHAGDVAKACKAAAEELGLNQPAARPAALAGIDPDTGEIFAPGPDVPPPKLSQPAKKDDATLSWPHRSSKGRILQTIENLQAVVEFLGVTVRYNVITKDEQILVPGHGFSRDNEANASLAWLTSKCEQVGLPTGRIAEYVTYLAEQNPYNPVAEWIESRPWDGQSRLQDLYDTVTAAGGEVAKVLKEAFMRRWLISAVAAAFEPHGVSAHGVLVFQGEQYLGKTHWFKRLVPRELGVVADGKLLKPDDRDSVKAVVSNWLVELGELDATFRKADIAQLKSFLTRDKDVFRKAYARRESEFARRTVFFASVNPKEFLHDQTGNRRYWTVECASIDHGHGIDMQQLWAEVLTIYRAGESWFLAQDEFEGLNAQNKDFEVIDPVEEVILSGLQWEDPKGTWVWKSATDVLRELGFDRPSQSDSTKASLFIRRRNGGLGKRVASSRLLLVPMKTIKRG